MAKRFYITTPIYYVNAVPHVGHATTTLLADVTKRAMAMRGHEAWFLTGTDENATKVFEVAQAQGEDPKAFVDRISGRFREIWDGMDFAYDDFIRTTEPRHTRAVQRFVEIMREKGYVYEDKYEGWYDVTSETFYKEADLVDGKSPDGNEVRWVSETNLFFRLSAFAEPLLAHIEAHPEFIQPENRRNEVLAFIRQGLRDMCITRQAGGWGIPVPGDPSRVVYVWFDALINYVTASGWPEEGWEHTWPAEVEFMAKDILTRFHATLWPAMLMAVGLPLPKHLVGHAYLLYGGEKMSKSKGNVVAPADAVARLVERAGLPQEVAVDALRYLMCAVLPYENDLTFSLEDWDQRYNSDLANDLGNALNRSVSMTIKFYGGTVPDGEVEPAVREAIDRAKAGFALAVDQFRVDRAAGAALDLARFLNKYIDQRAPWNLAKSHDPSLPAVLRGMLLALRTCEGLFAPILPTASKRIAAQLGLPPLVDWEAVGTEASLPGGGTLPEPTPLFPRMDLKAWATTDSAQAPAEPKPSKRPEKPGPAEEIEYADFAKVSLRVARIIEAEPLAGSEKLMRLQVRIGEESRQILAGIKKKYAPEDLIGRQIVVVANLKPAKLMGQESQGMLLAADDVDGSPILLEPESEAPEGTLVH